MNSEGKTNSRWPENATWPSDTNLDGGAHRWLKNKYQKKMHVPGTTDEAGLGELILCSFVLSSDLENCPVAQQLRYSLLSNMNTKDFKPTVALSVDEVKTLTAKKKEQALKN